MRKFMQRQICTSVAVGILIGNTAYQANNFVGAAEALYALGVPRHNPGIRVVIYLLLMMAILATLFLGDVDRVSAALGVVSILMIVVFGVAVGELGVNGSNFAMQPESRHSPAFGLRCEVSAGHTLRQNPCRSTI